MSLYFKSKTAQNIGLDRYMLYEKSVLCVGLR